MEILGNTHDGRIIGILSIEELDILEREKNTDPAPEVKPKNRVLDFGHVSQLGLGAELNRNDCMVACIVSVLRKQGYPKITVDEVSRKYQRPNKPMYIGEGIKAFKGYGVESEHKRPTSASDIKHHILEGEPVIALVDYEKLPIKARGYEHFKLPHYVLVYGYTEKHRFYYHDPLNDGRLLNITGTQLNHALESGSGNLPFQALFVSLNA